MTAGLALIPYSECLIDESVKTKLGSFQTVDGNKVNLGSASSAKNTKPTSKLSRNPISKSPLGMDV